MNIDTTEYVATAPAELHRIAEVRMSTHVPESPENTDAETSQQVVHDLKVHQIELEIQNEELRTARSEMQTSLEKYIDLYESAPAGCFTLNPDGSISAVNLAGANLLRIERSLVLGSRFETFVSEECRSTFVAFLETAFSDQGSAACEVVILDNVGLPIRVQIGASVTVPEGECRLVLIDVTGQKPAGLYGEGAGTIHDSADKMELMLSVCSLREALDGSLMLLWEKALRGGLTIHMDLAQEVDERIVADEEKLEQIIFSLLANAIRFTPAGGTIDIRAVREADFIKITVADTGTGIRVGDIPNLFEPFTEQESQYTRECEGTGPGLTLTRQLVELHGGTLEVESEFGTGSRFVFTIPLRNCAGIT